MGDCFIYIKSNQDWLDKCKYGYVDGNNNDKLINRLCDSSEEH